MRILRFDSVGGASGDMILGTLIDLGANVELIRKQLEALPIENFKIDGEQVTAHGFRGTRVTVEVADPEKSPHRNLEDIKQLIKQSKIPDKAADLSIRVFERLACAEAEVHGTTPDKIHFHEVGAVDYMIGEIDEVRIYNRALSESEVANMLATMEQKEEKVKPKILFDVGESIKVTEGPFVNFNGVVDEIYPDKGKMRVMVAIFGRETPVELEYWQVERA